MPEADDSASLIARPLLSGGHSNNPLDENLVALGTAPPLTHNPYGDHESREGLLIAHSLRADGFDASEDGTGRGTPIVPICFSAKDHGADAQVDLSPTLRAGGFTGSHANAGVMPAIAIQAGALRENPASGPDGVGVQSDLAYTVEARAEVQAVAYDIHGVPATTGATETNVHSALRSRAPGASEASTTTVVAQAFDMRGREGGAQFEGPHDTANIRASNGGSSRSYVAQQWAVRRLTPTECARLQGFPDDYLALSGAADGPQYKALGNSFAVPVVRWIGERIAAQDASLKQAEAA